MIKKVLIANRGEIALRIIQACREMGIATVAVHSTADEESLHVTYADEEVCIGPPPAARSYLDITALLAAAEITGADAIHPGYGFLAENPHFAEVVDECRLTWIGPRAETIRLMGDKAAARETARRAGVPILPGSEGEISSLEEAQREAREIGYPVILKAAAGGGGRGMRIVEEESMLESQLRTARAEAEASFGNGAVYLEKYLQAPRHVEVQIFGDRHGNVVHLGERDCSLQRRHQKLLEEAPAPGLSHELRTQIAEAAVRLAREVEYVNAGTIEFLLDEEAGFFFMEMNTRIQVEHPVTEMVTGVDLVKLQLQVAQGDPLDVPSDLQLRGHSIECRINAENPETFTPSPGDITIFHTPGGPGVRLDTHAYQDYRFPPFYDSLIGKLITWGRDRDEAIARMTRALDFFVIEGIDTTLPLHRKLIRSEAFRRAELSTRFMEQFVAGNKEKRAF